MNAAPPLEKEMYQALSLLPCACCRRWDKEAKDGFVVTKVCGKHRAMAAYEKAYPDLREEA